MVERTCPVCGTLYLADPKRLAYGRQTTCSRSCSYRMRADLHRNATTQPCAVCGTPTTRSSSRKHSKYALTLCSRECHYKARTLGLVRREVSSDYQIPEETRKAQAGRMRQINAIRARADGYGCTPEMRLKISRGVARAIAEGRISRVSQLERDVGKVLVTLGIEAFPQHGIRDEQGRFRAAVDYFIPSLGTALEVNGTFWHADPREYPNGPAHASQVRTVERYGRKLRFLKDQGIPVIEVWEADFKADPEGAVRKALGL